MAAWLIIHAPLSQTPLFPMGPAYISATLKSAGHRVACLDLYLQCPEHDEANVRKALTQSQPDVVAIGGLTRDYPRVKAALDAVRALRPDVPIVIGGGSISSAPELIFKHLGASYGILGEGEETVIELAKALEQETPAQGISGLILRGPDGSPMRTPERRPSRSIDEIPSPDYAGFDLAEYLDRQAQQSFKPPGKFDGYYLRIKNRRAVPIMLSRACPFPCTFCFHSISIYRSRSMDKVFEELDYLVGTFGANALSILDDLFAVKRERVLEFCRRVKPYGLLWSPTLRVDLVDREILEAMREAGCHQISYGLESMSSTVLSSMRKKTTPEQNQCALEMTYEARISSQGGFIFGDTAETVETANETIDWWLNNQKYGQMIGAVMVFPGTEIYRDCVRKGLCSPGIDYIEERCPSFNASQLTPHAYAQIALVLDDFYTTFRFPGQIETLEIDGSRGPDPVVTLQVRCPHCGRSVAFEIALADTGAVCPLCHGQFHLPVTLAIGRRLRPVEATMLLNKGISFFTLGLAELALHQAGQALEISPADLDAAALAGAANLQMNQPEKAMHSLLDLLAHSPNYAPAHVNLGIALYALGYVAWALAHMRHALFLDPSLSEAKSGLAVLMEELGPQTGALPYLLHQTPKRLPVERLQIAPPILLREGDNPYRWPPVREPLALITETPL
jgi:anaerobic magnesium-protoporphyrin IX monomethyl ester cyclase